MSKEILLQILKELVPIRDLAPGFITLIESGHFSPIMFKMLSTMLTTVIKETKDESKKQIFIQVQKKIKAIQAQEILDRKEEEHELKAMEEMLADI